MNWGQVLADSTASFGLESGPDEYLAHYFVRIHGDAVQTVLGPAPGVVSRVVNCSGGSVAGVGGSVQVASDLYVSASVGWENAAFDVEVTQPFAPGSGFSIGPGSVWGSSHIHVSAPTTFELSVYAHQVFALDDPGQANRFEYAAWANVWFSTCAPGTSPSFPLLAADNSLTGNSLGGSGVADGRLHPYAGANGSWYGPLLSNGKNTVQPRSAIVLQDRSGNAFEKVILPSSIAGNLYVDISGTQYGPYAAGDTIDFSFLRSPSGAVDIPSVGKLALVYVNGTDPAGVPLQIFQSGPSASFFEALIRAGDADFDGKVDFADLIALARHYGQAAGATWREGDFDGDGKVDFADLWALARNFGTMPTSSQLAQLDQAFRADVERAFADVPEPSSLAPLSLGCAVLLHRRRTRRAGCRIMGRGV